jgi:hypothetical protein
MPSISLTVSKGARAGVVFSNGSGPTSRWPHSRALDVDKKSSLPTTHLRRQCRSVVQLSPNLASS